MASDCKQKWIVFCALFRGGRQSLVSFNSENSSGVCDNNLDAVSPSPSQQEEIRKISQHSQTQTGTSFLLNHTPPPLKNLQHKPQDNIRKCSNVDRVVSTKNTKCLQLVVRLSTLSQALLPKATGTIDSVEPLTRQHSSTVTSTEARKAGFKFRVGAEFLQKIAKACEAK